MEGSRANCPRRRGQGNFQLVAEGEKRTIRFLCDNVYGKRKGEKGERMYNLVSSRKGPWYHDSDLLTVPGENGKVEAEWTKGEILLIPLPFEAAKNQKFFFRA